MENYDQIITTKGWCKMTPRQVAEILCIIKKLQIENDPRLTREEKEIWKLYVDALKEQLPKDVQF